ncbi:MAG: hypothetical protein V1908_02825 [Candidatus Peregrinibacteria bacterium]
MTVSSKKIIRNLALLLLLGLGLFLAAKTAAAQGALGSDWAQFMQKTGLRNFSGAGSETGETLAIGFIKNVVRIVKYVVGALAALFGIMYATALIFSGDKEETIKKQQKNFIGLAIAFVLLMVADPIARIFNPEESTSTALIDFGAFRDQLRDIVNYAKWLLGSIAVLTFSISGIKLITAQGEEEKITKEKKNLVWSLIGLLVVLLASNIVNAIYVVQGEAAGEAFTGAISPAAITTPIQEVVGIIRLLLVFLGPVAVLFTIYAGFSYLTSLGNDEQVTKGKSMLVGGVTGIIIIYIAYAIANTVLKASFAG